MLNTAVMNRAGPYCRRKCKAFVIKITLLVLQVLKGVRRPIFNYIVKIIEMSLWIHCLSLNIDFV